MQLCENKHINNRTSRHVASVLICRHTCTVVANCGFSTSRAITSETNRGLILVTYIGNQQTCSDKSDVLKMLLNKRLVWLVHTVASLLTSYNLILSLCVISISSLWFFVLFSVLPPCLRSSFDAIIQQILHSFDSNFGCCQHFFFPLLFCQTSLTCHSLPSMTRTSLTSMKVNSALFETTLKTWTFTWFIVPVLCLNQGSEEYDRACVSIGSQSDID